MQVRDVLKIVSGALQDLEEGQEKRWKWTPEESGDVISLLDFFNFAVQAIAMIRPDSTAITKSVPLEMGVSQKIPKDALMLMNIVRNMGCDGDTPGKAVQISTVEMVVKMATYAKAGKDVSHYGYDRLSDPSVFWVYPPVHDCDDVWVEMVYSQKPKLVTCVDGCLPVKSVYGQAIAHHILAAIFAGDNDAANLTRSQYHAGMFDAIMGVKSQVDSTWPKTRGSV